MSVTLGGTPLNPNLLLEGVNEKPQVLHSQRPTLMGNNVIQIKPANIGASLKLIAKDSSGKQGWFCTSQIAVLKTLANLASQVTLIYFGASYSVYIIEIETEEWYSWEPPNDNKRFSGTIHLQEV